MFHNLRSLSSGILLFFLAGCSGATVAQDEEAAPPATRLPLARVQQEDIPAVVNLPGTVTALPDHSLKVAPAVAGKLVAVEVLPGQRVERGEILARLDDRPAIDQVAQADAALQSARAGVAQAETNLLLARNTLERMQMLYQEKIAPEKDLILARSQVETALAQVRAAHAQVAQARAARALAITQRTFTEVRSPIAGTVARRFLGAGDTADPTTPIAQIVDLATVIINADLPADTPATVRVGQRGLVRSVTFPDERVAATVSAVSPVVDLPSNTVAVQLRCPNPGTRFKEGQAVTVEITTGVHRNALTVPDTALVPDPEHPGAQMVYRVQEGKMTRVPVKTGLLHAHRIEITAGLVAGESVVAAGAYGYPDGTVLEAKR